MVRTVTDKRFLIGVAVGVLAVYLYTRYVSGMIAQRKDG